MARKLIYEVVLDSAAYTRQIRKVQEQTTAFAASTTKTNREMGSLARGAAAGSGAFQKFGRSLAFASGGFIAAQTGSEVLRTLIDAGYDGAKSQKALAAQMAASGESVQANRDIIEKASTSYSRFGFAEDDVLQGLTVLDRATGSVTQSTALLGVTADLARAKNLDFAAAGAIVGKVFGGQETALRRAVPGLDKHRHGLDLITEASQKLAGQAAANTTAQEKFQATLKNTEVQVGTLLLPAFDKLLDKLTKVASAIGTVAASLDKLSKIKIPSIEIPFHIKIFGGTDLGRVLKQSARGGADTVPGLNAALTILGMFGGGGKKTAPPAAASAPTPDTGFRSANLNAPYGTAQKAATQQNTLFDAMLGRRELRAGLLTSATAQLAAYKAIGRILTARIAATHDITRKLNLEDQGLQNAATVAGLQVQIAADLKQKQQDAAQKIKDQIDAARQEKMGWLDFAIERAQATKTIKDDLAAFRNKEQFLQGLIKKEGRTLELVSELWRVRQQIKDLNKKNGADGKDPLAGLFQVSSKQLTNILAAGTGLGAAGRRRLGFNIAGAEIQPVHVHLNLDGREVASVVTKQQTRDGNRTSKQTSGRRG